MALNLDRIKERMEKIQNKGGGSSNYWKPEDGAVVRILPSPDGDPVKDFHIHYEIARGGVLCPKRNFGDDCVVCSFASKLYATGKEKNIQEDMALAKKLFVSQRFFTTILVRGEEEQTPKIWSFGKTVWEDLYKLLVDPEYGDITDVDKGTDIVVSYKKAPGQSWAKTSIQAKRNTSKMTDSKEKTKQILESLPDLTTLYERKSSKEVEQTLNEFMLKDEEGDVLGKEVKKYAGAEGNSTSTGSNEMDSIEKAFQELTGE